MDFADDVAYSVHDVEDAVVGERVDPRVLESPEQRARVAAQVRAWYLPDVDDEEVFAALDRLSAEPYWVRSHDGSRASLAALKDMTSQLIGRFAHHAEQATRAVYGADRLTRYGAELVIGRDTVTEVATLKGIAAVFVMAAEDRQPVYARQQELLADLVRLVTDRAPDVLEPAFADDWKHAPDDATRLRAVTDQIASLTDVSAVAWHHRLVQG